MADIIKLQNFVTSQLTALAAFVDFIIDLQFNNATIVDAFTFRNDKQAAAKLIAAAQPTSCVFGWIGFRQSVVFVVDASASMATPMQTPNNDTMTRLEFITQQLGFVLHSSMQVGRRA